MSNSGWSGPGNGPQGGPWQNGRSQNGQPQGGEQQGWGPQGGGQLQGTPQSWDPQGGALNGSPQNGAPQGWGPQGGQRQGDTQGWGPQGGQHGSASPAPWQGQPSPAQGAGSGGPQGPYGGGPQAPGPGAPHTPAFGAAQGTGGAFPAQQQPIAKRPWVLIGVALSCVLALLLVVGGGITFLLLSQGDDDAPVASDTPSETESGTDTPTETGTGEETEQESTTPEEAEESGFEVISPLDTPPGDADDMLAILQDNPLTEGTLPSVASCDLPETPVEPSTEELQAVLDAASLCLNQVWSTASSDRGLPWSSPSVEVYKHPDVPSDSPCEDHYSADSPRMCNLNSTLYWPEGSGSGSEFKDAANVPAAYLWDLAVTYSEAVNWNSSVAFYYVTMNNQLDEEGETERRDESIRRHGLQMICLGSAASMQVPSAAEPSPAVRDALTDPAAWPEADGETSVTPEARTRWIEAGFESGGDLSKCNTWEAEVDQVT